MLHKVLEHNEKYEESNLFSENRKIENLVSKNAAIDFASIVAEAIISRSSGRRRWICIH